MAAYTPKTGAKCACKRGIERDNCPRCEGTGWVIDFAAIHAARKAAATRCPRCQGVLPESGICPFHGRRS